VKNNPERDVQFVAYRSPFSWVGRRQAGNDISGHNATLTVLFPLEEVTEVWIVGPSQSLALAAWLGISLPEFSLRISLNDQLDGDPDRADDAGSH
jgi:hypothetical protein